MRSNLDWVSRNKKDWCVIYMTLNEFIEAYKNQDETKVGSVKIRKYISLAEKFDIIKSMEDKFFDMETQDRLNPMYFVREKQLVYFFDVLLKYTDLEVDERTEAIYDECMVLDIDKFIKHYCASDYNRFCKIVDEEIQVSDAYLLRSSLMEASSGMLNEEMDKLFEGINENKEVFEHLGDILMINNKGLKKSV